MAEQHHHNNQQPEESQNNIAYNFSDSGAAGAIKTTGDLFNGKPAASGGGDEFDFFSSLA